MKSELRDCQKQELEDGKGKMKAEKTEFFWECILLLGWVFQCCHWRSLGDRIITLLAESWMWHPTWPLAKGLWRSRGQQDKSKTSQQNQHLVRARLQASSTPPLLNCSRNPADRMFLVYLRYFVLRKSNSCVHKPWLALNPCVLLLQTLLQSVVSPACFGSERWDRF